MHPHACVHIDGEGMLTSGFSSRVDAQVLSLVCKMPPLCKACDSSVCNCMAYLLQDFPAKWIYEPWKAPIADQKQANCRIGVDYPKPMVDHASVSKDNIQKLKDAYADQSPSKGKSPSHASSPSGTSPSHARKKQASRAVGMRVPCVCVCVCVCVCT